MKIGVIGGGAWGTALAQVAAQGGAPVTALGARAEVVALDQRAPRQRPVPVERAAVADDRRRPTISTRCAMRMRCWWSRRRSMCAACWATPISAATPLVLCAKGIEAGTRLLVGEVAREVQPRRADRGAVGPDLRA